MGKLDSFNPLESLKESILNNYDEILEVNKEQLDMGEDSTGADMGNYSPFTASIKGRIAPIDLKDTGSYRDKTYLDITDAGTEIKSRDVKTEKIKAYVKRRTGGDPLGIQKDNLPRVAAIVRPQMIEKFRNKVT